MNFFFNLKLLKLNQSKIIVLYGIGLIFPFFLVPNYVQAVA